MATVEVFTIGGGEYIVNVFNAVAAWTGQGGYKSLIQVVLVMGFAMACLTIAFNSDWRAWINWFLQATLMYACLMVPRVDVQVVDRINPSLAPSFVANVPLGLGIMASFTSQVGDYLTTSAETVFGLPNDMQYSTNGMVYGARLIDAQRGLRLNDPEFATNLDEHIRNCVFYDVLLGHKSMTAIANNGDLWGFLGPGSPAQSAEVYQRRHDGGDDHRHRHLPGRLPAALRRMGASRRPRRGVAWPQPLSGGRQHRHRQALRRPRQLLQLPDRRVAGRRGDDEADAAPERVQPIDAHDVGDRRRQRGRRLCPDARRNPDEEHLRVDRCGGREVGATAPHRLDRHVLCALSSVCSRCFCSRAAG